MPITQCQSPRIGLFLFFRIRTSSHTPLYTVTHLKTITSSHDFCVVWVCVCVCVCVHNSACVINTNLFFNHQDSHKESDKFICHWYLHLATCFYRVKFGSNSPVCFIEQSLDLVLQHKSCFILQLFVYFSHEWTHKYVNPNVEGNADSLKLHI